MISREHAKAHAIAAKTAQAKRDREKAEAERIADRQATAKYLNAIDGQIRSESSRGKLKTEFQLNNYCDRWNMNIHTAVKDALLEFSPEINQDSDGYVTITLTWE